MAHQGRALDGAAGRRGAALLRRRRRVSGRRRRRRPRRRPDAGDAAQRTRLLHRHVVLAGRAHRPALAPALRPQAAAHVIRRPVLSPFSQSQYTLVSLVATGQPRGVSLSSLEARRTKTRKGLAYTARSFIDWQVEEVSVFLGDDQRLKRTGERRVGLAARNAPPTVADAAVNDVERKGRRQASDDHPHEKHVHRHELQTKTVSPRSTKQRNRTIESFWFLANKRKETL